MDATERKDDLPARKGLGLAANADGDAGGAAAIEGDVGHRRTADDGEITPRADVGGEIADRRRGALARPVADWNDGVAVAEVGVHVGDEGKLPLLGEAFQRLGDRRPLSLGRAPDRPGALGAVRPPAKSWSDSSLL